MGNASAGVAAEGADERGAGLLLARPTDYRYRLDQRRAQVGKKEFARLRAGNTSFAGPRIARGRLGVEQVNRPASPAWQG
jgi:hypothetical protein